MIHFDRRDVSFRGDGDDDDDGDGRARSRSKKNEPLT